MAWTVILEDEEKETLLSLEQEFDSKFLHDVEFYLKLKLLKYLDPYGDTVYNRLQMIDLIADLSLLQENDNNSLIGSIINLAEECKEQSHTYLVFYGE